MNSIKHFTCSIFIILVLLPFNYFFKVNFNPLPIQVFVVPLLLSAIYKLSLKNFILITISIITIFITARFNLIEIFRSAIFANFIVIFLLLIFIKDKKSNIDLYKVIIFFILLTMFYSLFQNYFFASTLKEENLRSKGFGSGTIYSLLTLYSITFIYILYTNKLIKRGYCYIGLIPFIWTLLLTQSRGVIITIIFVFFYTEIKRNKYYKWVNLVIIASIIFIIFLSSEISNRFLLSNYDNLEKFSSGRSTTQLYLIKDIFSINNFSNFFFGFGFNSLKQLVQFKGLEFPHLDLLYILYEGGILLVIIYYLLMYKFYKSLNNKLFFWLYFISSLHTNMVLSPGFLVLSKIMDSSIHIKLINENHRISKIVYE